MVDPQVLKDQMIHEVTLDFMLTDSRKLELMVVSEDTAKPEEKNDNEVLLPLENNRIVVLENIFFEQSRPDITRESYPSLRKLANVLKRRSDVIVRIEGHTDNVGIKKDLMELSWKRAEAIKLFLIKQGVSEENIQTIGYGDSHPLNNNSTEFLREQNRRVEIRVIKQ